MSANADYDVSIVESFAPPKNWSPGQQINKDVYAINTGTVEAFVNEDVSSKLTYTVERLKDQAYFNTGTNKDNCLTLTADEVDKVKAGAYLAGAFDSTGTKITGVDSGAIAEYFNNGKNTDPLTTADFTPDTTGVYFFRRSIAVADDQSEAFTYDAYYFDNSTKTYYEIKDIRPNENMDYAAGDNKDDDGTLTKVPEYKFVIEATETVTPTLTYEAAVTTGSEADRHPQRLVAKYNTNVGLTDGDGAAIDSADKDITKINGLLDQLNDAKNALDAAKAAYEAKVGEKNAAITTIAYYAGETNADSITAQTNVTAIGNTATSATKLVSGYDKIVASGVIAAQLAEYDKLVDQFNPLQDQITAKNDALNSTADGSVSKNLTDAETAEATALSEFNAAKASFTSNYPGHDYDAEVAYITEPPTTTDPTYEAWQKEQAYKAAQATTAAARAAKQAVQDELTTLQSQQASLRQKLIDLAGQINTNINALNVAITARGTADTQATAVDPDRASGEQAAYEAALGAYNDKLKEYNAARAKYEANDGTGCDITIYINLSDKVTTGNATANDQWQLIPVNVGANTAHFYYSGILDAGESSSKLIDSVELDKDVSQKAFKYFDFDLNIGLDSAQAIYADDQKTILTTAVDDNATVFESRKATLQTPTDKDTVVYWN